MTLQDASPAIETGGALLTVAALLAVFPMGLVGLWLQLLLHELAHAAALALVGGEVHSIEVGGGRWVLARRWFGVRVELRLLPKHGVVHGVVPGARAYRMRRTLVLLAGPLASTVLAVGLCGCALRWMGPRTGVDHRMALLGIGGAVFASVAAILAWLPRMLRIGDLSLPSDTLQAWRLWWMSSEVLATARAAAEQESEQRAAFECFLAGDAERALALVRGKVPMLVDATVYFWALHGAGAAMRELREVAAAFARAEAKIAAEQRRRVAPVLAQVQLVIDLNTVFFAAEAGGDALPEAEPVAAKLWARLPRPAVVYRTVGLFNVHAGDVARGLQALTTAWGRVEPAYARAITALGLAFAHARRGDAPAAQRFLRKAARLHPESPMVARYRGLVENALAGAPAPA